MYGCKHEKDAKEMYVKILATIGISGLPEAG